MFWLVPVPGTAEMEDVAAVHEDAGDGGERLCETDHAHVVCILQPPRHKENYSKTMHQLMDKKW
jgi:hypothetical protein